MMSTYRRTLKRIFVYCLCIGLLLFGGTKLTSAQESIDENVRTISVTGIGTASGAPDIAVIDVGVEIQNADVATAVEEVNRTMDDVIAALSELEIAEEDIQTQSYNIHQQAPPQPVTDQSSEQQNLYAVSTTAQIRVRNTDQISEVIQTALDAGANRMYGLHFSLEDTTALASNARQNAVDNARMRAEELAQLFGVTLGDVLQITERNGGGGQFPLETATIGGSGGGPSIREGQLTVTVELDVTFEIVNSSQ